MAVALWGLPSDIWSRASVYCPPFWSESSGKGGALRLSRYSQRSAVQGQIIRSFIRSPTNLPGVLPACPGTVHSSDGIGHHKIRQPLSSVLLRAEDKTQVSLHTSHLDTWKALKGTGPGEGLTEAPLLCRGPRPPTCFWLDFAPLPLPTPTGSELLGEAGRHCPCP